MASCAAFDCARTEPFALPFRGGLGPDDTTDMHARPPRAPVLLPHRSPDAVVPAPVRVHRPASTPAFHLAVGVTLGGFVVGAAVACGTLLGTLALRFAPALG